MGLISADIQHDLDTQGYCLLPVGTHTLTEPIVLRTPEEFATNRAGWAGPVVKGVHPKLSVLDASAISGHVFHIEGTPNEDDSKLGQCGYPCFEDLAIIGGDNTGYGIYLRCSWGATFRRVKIINCQSGIFLDRQTHRAAEPGPPAVKASREYMYLISLYDCCLEQNRLYGLEGGVGFAIGQGVAINTSFSENGSGGAYGPLNFRFLDCYFAGNKGPAATIVDPLNSKSQLLGACFIGSRFEKNVLDSILIGTDAPIPIIGCEFLCSNDTSETVISAFRSATASGVLMEGGRAVGHAADPNQQLFGGNFHGTVKNTTRFSNYHDRVAATVPTFLS